MQQAIIRDQLCHLQLIKPQWSIYKRFHIIQIPKRMPQSCCFHLSCALLLNCLFILGKFEAVEGVRLLSSTIVWSCNEPIFWAWAEPSSSFKFWARVKLNLWALSLRRAQVLRVEPGTSSSFEYWAWENYPQTWAFGLLEQNPLSSKPTLSLLEIRLVKPRD